LSNGADPLTVPARAARAVDPGRPSNKELEQTKPAISSVRAGFAAQLRCSPDRLLPARPTQTEYGTAVGTEVRRPRHYRRPVEPTQPPDANVHFSGVLYPAVRVVVAGSGRWVGLVVRQANEELEKTKPDIPSVRAGFAAQLRCSPDLSGTVWEGVGDG